MPSTATIGGTTVGAPTSNMSVGVTGTSFLSWMSSVTGMLAPNNHEKVFQKYGRGLLFRDMIRAKGQERNAGPREDLNIIEETAYRRPIKLKTAIAVGAAGESITVVLHADNYEGTKSPLQPRDIILIPARYLASGQNNSASYIAMTPSTVALTYDTWVCYPLNDASDIDTEIPAGTELSVGANAWAEGEDQPSGKNNYPVAYQYTKAIVKATRTLQESVLASANQVIEYSGNRWIVNRFMMELERDLEFYEDEVCHHGQKNDNQSVLVSTDTVDGDSGILRSSDGITTLMDTYSMCDYYDTTFEASHLDNVTESFRAAGLPTTSVAGYCGHAFMNDMYDFFRDYFGQYSSTDLYDRVKNMLGVSPTCLNWNGVDFYFQVLNTLSSPTNMGLTTSGDWLYEYPTSCMFIPDNMITVRKFDQEQNVSVPNIGIEYENFNGEQNGHVFGILKGMTNIEPGNLGTGKAGVYYFTKSTFKFFGAAWEQKVYYRKQRA